MPSISLPIKKLFLLPLAFLAACSGTAKNPEERIVAQEALAESSAADSPVSSSSAKVLEVSDSTVSEVSFFAIGEKRNPLLFSVPAF